MGGRILIGHIAAAVLPENQYVFIGCRVGINITGDCSRMILIGREVGERLTERPETWEEFCELVDEEGVAMWKTPMDDGLDFWCALRMDEAPNVIPED